MNRHLSPFLSPAFLLLFLLLIGAIPPTVTSHNAPDAITITSLNWPSYISYGGSATISWRVDGAASFGHNNVHYGGAPCPDITCYPLETPNQPGGPGVYSATIQNITHAVYFRIHASAGLSNTAEVGEFNVLSPDLLDPNFASGGKLTADFPHASNAMAVDPDGRIVVAGGASSFNASDIALARYTPDGDLDTTFGADGKVRTDFGGSEGATGVVIQPDGRIVVAGSAYVENVGNFALARYLSDGVLDATFGVNGMVTTDFGGSERASALAIQPDGKIVVAGLIDYGGDRDFVLARYTSDGSLDESFGTGGKVTTDFGSADDRVSALAIQPDGRIVVAGRSFSAGDSDFALARYTSTGGLDPTFGGDGLVLSDLSDWYYESHDSAEALVIQPDGKIVAGGWTAPKVSMAHLGSVVVRYQQDGQLDASFGSHGFEVFSYIGPDHNAVRALALQPDGKLLAAGHIEGYYGADVYHTMFGLARLTPDGHLDPTFGEWGRVTTNFLPDDFAVPYAVGIQPDCRIVLAGASYSQTLLARYRNPVAGCTDFDGNGQVTAADVQAVAMRWGLKWGDPEWDDRFDLDHSWRVDLDDVMRVGAAWGVSD